MSTLLRLIGNMEVRGAVERLTANQAARRYLQGLTDEQFKVELQDIKEPREVGRLIGLGLVNTKWHIVMDYIGELEEK